MSHGPATTDDCPGTVDVDVLESFEAVVDRLERQGLFTPSLTLEQLGAALDSRQKEVVRQILDLDPGDYGVGTPYVGLEDVPSDR